MNRPALAAVLTPPAPVSASRHLVALDTPDQIHAHMARVRAANARENLRAVIAISVFVGGVAVLTLTGLFLLRCLILIAQG